MVSWSGLFLNIYYPTAAIFHREYYGNKRILHKVKDKKVNILIKFLTENNLNLVTIAKATISLTSDCKLSCNDSSIFAFVSTLVKNNNNIDSRIQKIL